MRATMFVRTMALFCICALALVDASLHVGAEGRSNGPDSGSTTGFTQYTDPTQASTWYEAFASSTTTIDARYVYVSIQGYDNGLGWHATQGTSCHQDAYASPRSCSTGVIIYDTVPDSGSTDRYAATQHYFTGGVGDDTFYTSSDGNHSTDACWFNAGC